MQAGTLYTDEPDISSMSTAVSIQEVSQQPKSHQCVRGLDPGIDYLQSTLLQR